MRNFNLFFGFVVVLLINYVNSRPLETYSESLYLRRLDLDSVGIRYEFVSRKAKSSDLDDLEQNQFETFPKIIGQVISANVTDLRLVMTRGRWIWGSETMWPSIESGAPGVELWAKLNNPSTEWTKLVRALAGMTCASLDVLQQKSNYGKSPQDNNILFATMPSETVCTENISPWLKLLPCRSRAGLGRLISAKVVVNAQYYSLALSTRRTSLGIELIQSLSLVLPIKSSLAASIGSSSLMDTLSNSCAVATNSHIVLETDQFAQFEPAPHIRTSEYAAWNLPLANHSDIQGLEKMSIPTSIVPLRTVKWHSGWGDLRGTFSTALYNDHPKKDLQVKHLEIIPSFLRPRLGTLKVFIGDEDIGEEKLRSITKISSTLLRGPYATFELDLVLPKNGTRVLITYSFNKAFLFFDEFPPNPNRGFDVPSAITFCNRTFENKQQGGNAPGVWIRSKSGPLRRASEALLVTLPQPDFSMPYNVITLSSTGFALFFGMLVNISVRRRGDRWVTRDKSIFENIRDKVRSKILSKFRPNREKKSE